MTLQREVGCAREESKGQQAGVVIAMSFYPEGPEIHLEQGRSLVEALVGQYAKVYSSASPATQHPLLPLLHGGR